MAVNVSISFVSLCSRVYEYPSSPPAPLLSLAVTAGAAAAVAAARFPVAAWIVTPAHWTGQAAPWPHLTMLPVVVLVIAVRKTTPLVIFSQLETVTDFFPFKRVDMILTMQRENDMSYNLIRKKRERIQQTKQPKQKKKDVTKHRFNLEKMDIRTQQDKPVEN